MNTVEIIITRRWQGNLVKLATEASAESVILLTVHLTRRSQYNLIMYNSVISIT